MRIELGAIMCAMCKSTEDMMSFIFFVENDMMSISA